MNNVSFKRAGCKVNGKNIILEFPGEQQNTGQIRQEIKDILVSELCLQFRPDAQCKGSDEVFSERKEYFRI